MNSGPTEEEDEDEGEEEEEEEEDTNKSHLINLLSWRQVTAML